MKDDGALCVYCKVDGACCDTGMSSTDYVDDVEGDVDSCELDVRGECVIIYDSIDGAWSVSDSFYG